MNASNKQQHITAAERDGRACVICGKPAWLDLREGSGPELWVCLDHHIAQPDWLELSLVLRELGKTLVAEIRLPLERVLTLLLRVVKKR